METLYLATHRTKNYDSESIIIIILLMMMTTE